MRKKPELAQAFDEYRGIVRNEMKHDTESCESTKYEATRIIRKKIKDEKQGSDRLRSRTLFFC